jgi:hypothetical protein
MRGVAATPGDSDLTIESIVRPQGRVGLQVNVADGGQSGPCCETARTMWKRTG